METEPTSCFMSTTLTHGGLLMTTLFRRNFNGTWDARRRFDLPQERREWLEGPWIDVHNWRSCTREQVMAYAGMHGGEWYHGLVEAMEALIAKQEQIWELAYMTAWGGGNRHG